MVWGHWGKRRHNFPCKPRVVCCKHYQSFTSMSDFSRQDHNYIQHTGHLGLPQFPGEWLNGILESFSIGWAVGVPPAIKFTPEVSHRVKSIFLVPQWWEHLPRTMDVLENIIWKVRLFPLNRLMENCMVFPAEVWHACNWLGVFRTHNQRFKRKIMSPLAPVSSHHSPANWVPFFWTPCMSRGVI